MTTWDAPRALATIKHTNPMGPDRGEKGEGLIAEAPHPEPPFFYFSFSPQMLLNIEFKGC